MALMECAECRHVDQEGEGGERRYAWDGDRIVKTPGKVWIGFNQQHDLLFDCNYLSLDLPELLDVMAFGKRQSQALCSVPSCSPVLDRRFTGYVQILEIVKTIKRAMYGRAGPELLRARMMPIKLAELHTK